MNAPAVPSPERPQTTLLRSGCRVVLGVVTIRDYRPEMYWSFVLQGNWQNYQYGLRPMWKHTSLRARW